MLKPKIAASGPAQVLGEVVNLPSIREEKEDQKKKKKGKKGTKGQN